MREVHLELVKLPRNEEQLAALKLTSDELDGVSELAHQSEPNVIRGVPKDID